MIFIEKDIIRIMGKYLKKFDSHAEYNAFTATTAFILPNVSLCVNEDDLHYNPLVRVSGVTLDKSELSLKEGDIETLVASVLPSNASNKNVVWSSSDDSIATVDNGVVSGVGVGNATITVTTEDGGFIAQCAATVKNYKVITYTATSKLPETTNTGSTVGLHTSAFSGTSGQRLTMVSHTFDDGVGTVTFNGDIAKFGDYAFYSATTLASIDIPDSVTSIGNSAFQNCSGLTNCTIGSGVTSIGVSAFTYCRSLSNIVIPDSVTSLGYEAFSFCSGLTSVTIGNGVTSTGDYTFRGCSSLTSIDIPDSITTVGRGAFYSCKSLTSCTIGSGVTSIGNAAFSACSGLTSVTIPDNVTSIGQTAFSSCSSLTSCTIGSGVTSIDADAFRYCNNLVSVTVEAITPPTLGSGVFENNASGRKIYVPSESVETYKSASGWNVYASDIQAIP